MSVLLYYGIYLIIYVVCYTIVMLDIKIITEMTMPIGLA